MSRTTVEDMADDGSRTEVSRVVHHLPAAVLGALAVAALVEGLGRGEDGRLAAVAGLQAALVVAWVIATARREWAGALLLAAATAAAADLVFLLPERPAVGGLVGILGIALPAAVLRQMFRRPPREALVASLAGSVVLLCAVCSLAFLLRSPGSTEGAERETVALLAVGAALVAAHLVDLVLPRPQVAYGVPRGLLGLVLAVLAAGAVTWLRRRPEELFDALGAVIYGGAIGGLAVLVSLVASYVVVQADRTAGVPRRGSRWVLPVIQALLPIAACAPVALALAYRTAF